jgi:hypothetical protein
VAAIVYAAGECAEQWRSNLTSGANPGVLAAIREVVFSPESAYFFPLILALLFSALLWLQHATEASQPKILK